MHTPKTIRFLRALLLVVLIVSGVLLFFFRERHLPQSNPHELIITASHSELRIVDNQFLILPHVASLVELENILEPLHLKMVAPILQWVLVENGNQPKSRIITFDSSEAEEARLILSSLKQHQHILDAQHNFVLHPCGGPRPDNVMTASGPAGMELVGKPNVSIAIVDTFRDDQGFTFANHFPECMDRVTYFAPRPSATLADSHTLHGELMLLSLGACGKSAQLIAMDEPHPGHAQHFLAALSAAAVDICQESILPCPDNFRYQFRKEPSDVILLPFGNAHPDLLQFSADMVARITHAKSIVVTASGNNDDNAANFFPGGAPGVINVGSINSHNKRSSFSNWGDAITIMAPGEGIDVRYHHGSKRVYGTSMAASLVAQTVGLMKAVDPQLSYRSAQYFLVKEATPLSCDDYCSEYLFNHAENCREECCVGAGSCGMAAVNARDSIKLAKRHIIDDALIELSATYDLFLRNEVAHKISVKNLSARDVYVVSESFNDQLEISPPTFVLKPSNSEGDTQDALISFKKEPFKRETIKVVFKATAQNHTQNTSALYIEYIPKG